MKVILLKDVAKVGRRGEVAEVNEGHARNFLMPRGFVKPATPQDLRAIEMHEKKSQEKYNQVIDAVHKTFDVLDGKVISITARANEKGHLFSSITSDDVVKALFDNNRVIIEENWIEMDKKSIKEVGEHPFTLKHAGKTVNLVLKIVGEK